MDDITQDQADYLKAHYQNYGDRKLARLMGKSKQWVKRARIAMGCLRTREERNYMRSHDRSDPHPFEPASDLPYLPLPPRLSRSGKAAVALSFLVPLAIYLLTIAPGPAGERGAELAAWASGNLPQSPASPLYLLIVHGIAAIPLGELAFRLNLFSTVTGALTSLSSMLLCYRLTHRVAVSLSLALLLAFATPMWRSSVTTSAIMPAYLCAAIASYFLMRFCECRRPGPLFIAAVAAGAAVTIHPWPALFAPAFFLALWICHRQRKFEPGLWLGILIIALLVVQLCVYLPFMAKSHLSDEGFTATLASTLGNPDWLWEDSSPGFFLNLLKYFHTLQQSVWPVPGCTSLSSCLSLLLLLASCYGAYLLRRNRPLKLLLITCVITTASAILLFAVKPIPEELEVSALLLPLPWACFLLAATAVARLAGTSEVRNAVFAVIAAVLLFSQVYSHWDLSSYRNWDFPTEYGKTAWQNIPDHAVLVPSSPTSYYYLLYSRPPHSRVEILTPASIAPDSIMMRYPGRPLYCGWVEPNQSFSNCRAVPEGLWWRIVPIAQGFSPRPTALRKFPPLSANLSPGESRLLSQCHFIQLRDAIARGEADDALNSYAETGDKRGRARNLMANFARDLAMAPKYPKAVAIYQALIDDAPDADIYVAMARIRGVEGKTEEAIALYRKALGLVPDHFQALLELAKFLEKSERWDEAIALYRKLIEKYPQASYPYRRLAEILARDPAHKKEAEELAEQAKALEQREAEQRRVPDLPQIFPRTQEGIFPIAPRIPEIRRPQVPLPPVGPKLPDLPK